jgi:hypothetical protein
MSEKPKLTPLSTEEQERRRPPRPWELLEAIQDPLPHVPPERSKRLRLSKDVFERHARLATAEDEEIVP